MSDYGRFGDNKKRWRKNVKKMAAEGKNPVGLYVMIPDPTVIDLAAMAGFDYIWMDNEHAFFNPETICDMVRAADSAGLSVHMRVENLESIAHLADFGVVGFTVPHIHNAEEARAVINECKYSPVGRRGFADAGRAQRFGMMAMTDYVDEYMEEAYVSIMIEDQEGYKNYREICDVPGIDRISVGEADLTHSFGYLCYLDEPLPGEQPIDTTAARKAVDEIYAYADSKGIGRSKPSPRTICNDRVTLLSAMEARLKEYRKTGK